VGVLDGCFFGRKWREASDEWRAENRKDNAETRRLAEVRREEGTMYRAPTREMARG
jgi:hypothetical protein